jgi:hypothetical protein
MYAALATACTTHEKRLHLLWAEPLKRCDEFEERSDGKGGINLRELCKQARE